MNYKQWLQKVNDVISMETGLDLEDLPDYMYKDDYEDGVPPEETADLCIMEAGLY